MSGLTGYLTIGGVDLSYIFQSGTSNIITGFLLPNGDDIGKIFAMYSTNVASNTGLICINNADICTLFNANIFSPLSILGCCLWMDANDSTKINLPTRHIIGRINLQMRILLHRHQHPLQ